MIDVEYAQKLDNFFKEYAKYSFEEVENEAKEFNEEAYYYAKDNGHWYGDWKAYLIRCTARFRYYDIVEIAKVLRKLLKKEFGTDIKFNIKSERGFETDALYITIKPQNEKYLQNLQEYMDEYMEEYYHRNGVTHPYINDEVFKEYAEIHIDRLDGNVRKKINKITHLFEMNNSDIQRDYFDINYVVFFRMGINNKTKGGWTTI